MDAARVAAELSRVPEVHLQVDGMTAWCVLATIQLACRHPGHTGPTRKIVEQFARALQDRIAPPDSELGRLAEKGWHGVFDVERSGS